MATTTVIMYKFFLSFLLISLLISTPHCLNTSKSDFTTQKFNKKVDIGCKGHQQYTQNEKCSYVKSHIDCHPKPGYIPYLELFYCTFNPPFGYIFLIFNLILIFYLLGDTSATYFCSSLEGLSSILKLTPTMSGVTLLALGNGAPDLFATIISFSGSSDGAKNVGLHGVLGSALFVTTVVVGIISITTTSMRLISMSSFLKDVIFLITTISILLVIIISGEINIWGAITFLFLYVGYVVSVCASPKFLRDDPQSPGFIPVSTTSEQPLELLEAPLLGYLNDEQNENKSLVFYKTSALNILYLPLWLPRRLTIPVASPEKWSKTFAVMSFTLAPMFLCVVWNNSDTPKLVYGVGLTVGLVMGLLVFFTTEKSSPPRKFLLAWFAAGFVMSMTWTYILAQELISLLVSLGLVFGIRQSVLGLTVLAWGNSLGDLVTNVTMARHGGPDGTQVAISGCYAGPIFNIIVGLGLSFVLCSWDVYPSSYKVPNQPIAYETIGFLILGLFWALLNIPYMNMRLNRFLGCGLIVIYLCFLSLEMARTVPF